jgi:hypothetical protein
VQPLELDRLARSGWTGDEHAGRSVDSSPQKGFELRIARRHRVVTLQGVVDSWFERRKAEESAWEGGAKDVKNLLVEDRRGS